MTHFDTTFLVIQNCKAANYELSIIMVYYLISFLSRGDVKR